jgi:DNA repair photolyase
MKSIDAFITRKSLLYKTGVEYGDYTVNHVEGCSHGCRYPCYAMLMAKRFGKIHDYKEWIIPKIVKNAIELTENEISKYYKKIHCVHFCFTTDPFMYGYPEISDLTIKLMQIINSYSVKCSFLTKGIYPKDLAGLHYGNEFGITIVSLDETFRELYEPGTAPIKERIKSLYYLHKKGIKTWVSIEPYPTPNIIEQDIQKILKKVSFVDKVVFGKLNYNRKVSQFPDYKKFFTELTYSILNYCEQNNKDYHIKKETSKILTNDFKIRSLSSIVECY